MGVFRGLIEKQYIIPKDLKIKEQDKAERHYTDLVLMFIVKNRI